MFNYMFTSIKEDEEKMAEKRIGSQGNTAHGFVDIKKAFDTVERVKVTTTLIWMGVEEAEARIMEAMYDRTKGRVVAGHGMLVEHQVNIGLKHGNALSHLLFIMVYY